LQILGVLKTRQGGGAYVSSLQASDLLAPLQILITLNEDNVEGLYEARVMVDGQVAQCAAERLTDADIARLLAMVEVQKTLVNDPIGFRVSDLEFHRTIMDGTQNPFLSRVSYSLYVLGIEYRRIASSVPGVLRQSQADHADIAAALAARDADWARRATETHMRNVYLSTREAMEQVK